MKVVEEVKTLREDVVQIKRKTAEDELQFKAQIDRLQEQKKELESKFDTFQHSHSMEKEQLHITIVKLKKQNHS